MLRASAACERAGVPSASLVCEGFVDQAVTTTIGLGFPNLPLSLVPGHVGAQSDQELYDNITGATFDDVIDNLTQTPDTANDFMEPAPRDIVASGSFEDIGSLFYDNEWSDGLPIVPPTVDKIEEFLKFTNHTPDEVLGVILPDSRAATVWSIAVNGVMAGCRPQYMPVLVALIKAMVDPIYGVEHSGNTPGGETLITINGPIIKQLGFNTTQGVLRDGFMPNTAIGRFWRLYLRNIAGFLLHKNDKCTFGNTWRVVLAENEDVCEKIGWEPNSVEMGFAAGDNTVTISRYVGGNVLSSVYGDHPDKMMPYLSDALLRMHTWHIAFTIGTSMGTLRPLIILSPILAETIAKAGWSKTDVKQYLFDHARMTATEFERYLGDWTDHHIWQIEEQAKLGKIPKDFTESNDPDRLVPITFNPDDYMIVVAGDKLRTNAYVFAHNGILGYPTAKKIDLPDHWENKLAAADCPVCIF